MKPDADFLYDIVLDKLNFTEILLEVEDKFNIRIPKETAKDLKNIGLILEYLKKIKTF